MSTITATPTTTSASATDASSVFSTSVQGNGFQPYRITFHSLGAAIVICLLHLVGISILACFLTLRVRIEDFKSFRALRQISIARLYIVGLFIVSWTFFAIAGVLLQAVGLGLDDNACEAGILTCITLYSLSHLFVYLFLGERVHTVWCPGFTTPRYKSPLYILSMVLILAYLTVVCHLFVVRIATLHRRGLCLIGLQLNGVILLLIFDIVYSIVMTCLFIWPLIRQSLRHSYLRRIALRSVIAASIALSTSCVNISVLVGFGGVEFGWLCLLCWEADVLVSAIAFFWLTSGTGLRPIASLVEEARALEELLASAPTTCSPASSYSSPVADGRRTSAPWLRRCATNTSVPLYTTTTTTTTTTTKTSESPSSKRPEHGSRQTSLPTLMTHGLLPSLPLLGGERRNARDLPPWELEKPPPVFGLDGVDRALPAGQRMGMGLGERRRRWPMLLSARSRSRSPLADAEQPLPSPATSDASTAVGMLSEKDKEMKWDS